MLIFMSFGLVNSLENSRRQTASNSLPLCCSVIKSCLVRCCVYYRFSKTTGFGYFYTLPFSCIYSPHM